MKYSLIFKSEKLRIYKPDKRIINNLSNTPPISVPKNIFTERFKVNLKDKMPPVITILLTTAPQTTLSNVLLSHPKYTIKSGKRKIGKKYKKNL